MADETDAGATELPPLVETLDDVADEHRGLYERRAHWRCYVRKDLPQDFGRKFIGDETDFIFTPPAGNGGGTGA